MSCGTCPGWPHLLLPVNWARVKLVQGLGSWERVPSSLDRTGNGQELPLLQGSLCCLPALPESIAAREQPKAEPCGQPAELCKGYLTMNAINPKINTSVLPPRSGRLRDVKVSLC